MSEPGRPRDCTCGDELNWKFCRTHKRVWCDVCYSECADCETDELDYLQNIDDEGEHMTEKPASGLWRNDPATPEGKYLVKRRDGSVVEWPNFVLGAKDPATPAALRAYADEAEKHGFNAQYVSDVRALAASFEQYRHDHGQGDPDRGRHRVDDPETVREMQRGGSA